MSKKRHKKPEKPGPKGDRLKIPGQDWRDAMGKALKKKRPKKGWPDTNKED